VILAAVGGTVAVGTKAVLQTPRPVVSFTVGLGRTPMTEQPVVAISAAAQTVLARTDQH
jgi:hypothetical protein